MDFLPQSGGGRLLNRLGEDLGLLQVLVCMLKQMGRWLDTLSLSVTRHSVIDVCNINVISMAVLGPLASKVGSNPEFPSSSPYSAMSSSMASLLGFEYDPQR